MCVCVDTDILSLCRKRKNSYQSVGGKLFSRCHWGEAQGKGHI